MTTNLGARGADSKSNEEWKSRRHPETFDDGMTRCAEETLDIVKEMTTLCPAVEERVNKKATSTEEIAYMSGMNLGATLQREHDEKIMVSKERVRKALHELNRRIALSNAFVGYGGSSGYPEDFKECEKALCEK